jgi:4-diphosphocytidyl-2-C-methyl-D-erythritol kinase
MSERLAHAKINLALVVGPIRDDGKHEVTTVLQRIGLADRVALDPASEFVVEGFEADTLVRGTLELLAEAAGVDPAWRVRLDKQIPVAAGLGGGSSDAAAALALANETLKKPLAPARLHEVAAALGADVPFFLVEGPHLGEGDGSELSPLDLPQDFTVLLLLPGGEEKASTASVYAAFDARDAQVGYHERRGQVLRSLAARDLAGLPPNDLAKSPLAEDLRALGAFRADVSGAGPAVYGLFETAAQAERAGHQLEPKGQVWIVPPAW